MLDGKSIEIEKQDFVGTAGNDNISGLGGNDLLFGNAGDGMGEN